MPFRASLSVSKFCIKEKAVCDYKHIFEWDDELILKKSSRKMNPVQFLRLASRCRCPHSRLIGCEFGWLGHSARRSCRYPGRIPEPVVTWLLISTRAFFHSTWREGHADVEIPSNTSTNICRKFENRFLPALKLIHVWELTIPLIRKMHSCKYVTSLPSSFLPRFCFTLTIPTYLFTSLGLMGFVFNLPSLSHSQIF